MASRKTARAKKFSTKSLSKGKPSTKSASSLVLNLVGSVMGDSLTETVANIKSKVSEQVAIHGAEYLDSARERISEATTKVVTWGKKHPVKTVAAAAALIAVSGFLYATLNEKSVAKVDSMAKKGVAKLKTAAAG